MRTHNPNEESTLKHNSNVMNTHTHTHTHTCKRCQSRTMTFVLDIFLANCETFMYQTVDICIRGHYATADISGACYLYMDQFSKLKTSSQV